MCFQDFVCQMLQPRCHKDRLIRPCRAYCRAFHAGCGARLPERLRPHFDCGRFPDYFGLDSCVPEPGIVYSFLIVIWKKKVKLSTPSTQYVVVINLYTVPSFIYKPTLIHNTWWSRKRRGERSNHYKAIRAVKSVYCLWSYHLNELGRCTTGDKWGNNLMPSKEFFNATFILFYYKWHYNLHSVWLHFF